jgi:glycosyltransferase involved in cell wall biosynthesis
MTLRHDRNAGYGANQKTCYRAALGAGADVVVMLHPDYQYSPKLIPALAGPVASGERDVMLGSRMRDGGALAGGMPFYKYAGNRLLTAFQNRCLGLALTEYHTGFRAYSRRALEAVPWQGFSDGFLFDNEMLVAAAGLGLPIGEIACPARYERDSSSIGFARSADYGLGVLRLSWAHRRKKEKH